jgi:hypothetical protein
LQEIVIWPKLHPDSDPAASSVSLF